MDREGRALPVSEIVKLPVEKRVDAFVERWLELDEWTGCRTFAERDEMATIADAVMTRLIERSRMLAQAGEDMRVAFYSFEDAIESAQRAYHDYQSWTDNEWRPINAARDSFAVAVQKLRAFSAGAKQ
jgi:hypothetical protein